MRDIQAVYKWDGSQRQPVDMSKIRVYYPGEPSYIGAVRANLTDGGGGTDPEPPPDPTGARWAGHQPGKVILGIGSTTFSTSLTAIARPIGTRRQFFGWSETTGFLNAARDHLANRRIMWGSFGGVCGRTQWDAIAGGGYDADIRAKARGMAGLPGPVIMTVCHEVSADGTNADAASYHAAFKRIADVMRDEVGDLKAAGITVAPIYGEWLFNPRQTSDDPLTWVTAAHLDTIAEHNGFFGIDCYQDDSDDDFSVKLQRPIDILISRGHPTMMIGIGEVGTTSHNHPSRPKVKCSLNHGIKDGVTTQCDPSRIGDWPRSAAEFWADNWSWCAANTNRIGIVCYFDTVANSKAWVYWALDEPGVTGEAVNEKMVAFRASLDSSTFARLPA